MKRAYWFLIVLLGLLAVGSALTIKWASATGNARLEVEQLWQEFGDGWQLSLITHGEQLPPEPGALPDVEHLGFQIEQLVVTFPGCLPLMVQGNELKTTLSFEQAASDQPVLIQSEATEQRIGMRHGRKARMQPVQMRLAPPPCVFVSDNALHSLELVANARATRTGYELSGSLRPNRMGQVRFLNKDVSLAEAQYLLEGKLLETRRFKPDEALSDRFNFTLPRAASLKGKRLEAKGKLWHKRVGSGEWEQLPLAPAETIVTASPWAPELKVELEKYGFSKEGKMWLRFHSNTPHMRVSLLDKVIELDEGGYGALQIIPIPGHQYIEITGLDPALGGVVKERLEYFYSGLELELSPPTLDVSKREQLSLSVTSKLDGYATLSLRVPGSRKYEFIAQGPVGPGRPLKATWRGILPLTKQLINNEMQRNAEYRTIHVSAKYGDDTDQAQESVKIVGLIDTSPYWELSSGKPAGWTDDLPPPRPWRMPIE
jgi:hypothetical protein